MLKNVYKYSLKRHIIMFSSLAFGILTFTIAPFFRHFSPFIFYEIMAFIKNIIDITFN